MSETYDPEATVEDTKAFVEEHPEAAQMVLQAEREGKDRSTLITWLEGRDRPVTVEPATPGVIKSPDPLPDGTYPPTG